MNNARTIAALEKSIAQLTAIKDRLVAADAKAGSSAPAKKAVAKKSAANKTPTRKSTVKRTA